MKKKAGLAGAWESVGRHPLGAVSKMVGSALPVIGPGISAADAVNALYRGNLATAGLHGLGTVLGIVPGGGALTQSLAKGSRIGQTASRAIAPAAKIAPYVAPGAQVPGSLVAPLTQMGASIGAGTIDQLRAMKRPAVIKQMREQEQMMRDFQEWQRHRNTLHRMGKTASVKTAQSAPQAIPVAQPVDYPLGLPPNQPPLYGDVARQAWRLSTHPTVAAALLAAQVGSRAGPALSRDDWPGAARGAITGLGAGLGTMGGLVGGALGGTALGRLLASRVPGGGVSPAFASAGLGTLGGALGAYTGHKLVGGAMEEALDGGDGNYYPYRRKFGSALTKEAISPRNPVSHALGALAPVHWPDYAARGAAAGSSALGRLGGMMGTGLGSASELMHYGGGRAGQIGIPMGQIHGAAGRAGAPMWRAMPAAAMGHLGRLAGAHPVLAGGLGLGAGLLGTGWLLSKLRGGKDKEASEKIAVRETDPASVIRQLASKGTSIQEVVGRGTPPRQRRPKPGDLGSAMRRGAARASQQAAEKPKEAPAPPKPEAPKVEASPAGPPPGAGPIPVAAAAAPSLWQQIKAHPIYRWGQTPHGKATMLAALATAGTGAYLLGRRKRKKEDEEAEKELRQAG